MILGIDASNIRDGGGVTHLVELLRHANPIPYGIHKVIVWSGKSTLIRIQDKPWLVKNEQMPLNKSLPWRIFWQRFRLSSLARSAGCSALFVPGGSYSGDFRPFVIMSQNMLPFERSEFMRFGFSFMTIKMMLLRWAQSRSFKNADGIIFLTRYAHDAVLRTIKKFSHKKIIIPHGVDDRFRRRPVKQLPIEHYSTEKPFRILYVSIVDVYKHQWHVAEAVASLRRLGLPVVLDLVGPAYPPALKRFKKHLLRIDPEERFIRYSGPISYNDLHSSYGRAEMALFASSCENMPNILLEKMASGLPVVCSNRGPMPEMLGSTGIYFDPEKPDEIASAILKLAKSPELRNRLSEASFERSQSFSWERCAKETFSFFTQFASNPLLARTKIH